MELLKYILPALIVLATTWLVLYKMFKEQRDQRDFEMKKNTRKEITSLRLRGYERLALLLERTTPEHMLRDLDIANLNVRELQILLLQTIRTEFDHNLSQQVYVTDTTWDAIMIVQQELIRFVNTCAANFPADCNALEYAQHMITVYTMNGETPTQAAQKYLRAEARQLLA